MINRADFGMPGKTQLSAALKEIIEDKYGLPPGSVSIRNPDGTNSRSDKKIGNLKTDHEQK